MAIDWTAIGTGITVIATVYGFLRNFKNDMNKKFEHMENRLDLQEERIFLLATGKTLREAMVEAKRNMEQKE